MPWYMRLLRRVEIGLYAIFFAGLLGGSSLLISTEPSEASRRYTRSVEFDFVYWTLDALSVKLDQAALGIPYYFTETARYQIVEDYLHLMEDILTSEYQLNLAYTDPQVLDPAAASLTLQTELDRDLAGSHVDDHHRDEERAHSPGSLLQEVRVLLLEGLHPADAGTDEHADALTVEGVEDESGIADRLGGGHHRILDEAIHALRLLAIQHTLGRETLQLAGEPAVVARRVETRDGPGATLPRDELIPGGRGIVAERGYGPRPGHEHTSVFSAHVRLALSVSFDLCAGHEPPGPRLRVACSRPLVRVRMVAVQLAATCDFR